MVVKKIIVFVLMVVFFWGIKEGICRYLSRDSFLGKSSEDIIVEGEKVLVEDYYIYGRNLNFKGDLSLASLDFKSIKLMLVGSEKKYYDVVYEKTENGVSFCLSKSLNEGMILDHLEVGEYSFYIEVVSVADDGQEIRKYYAFQNNTNEARLAYSSLKKYQREVEILFDKQEDTLRMSVRKSSLKGVYDIVLDSGHGGSDAGVVRWPYKESALTLKLNKKLKEELESYGYTVKMTREADVKLDAYSKGGRAVLPHEVKAKYVFSIHYNSSVSKKASGIEIYTPQNIRYDFAHMLADNLVQDVGIGYSKNIGDKMGDGVYTRVFTEEERQETNRNYLKKGYRAYNIQDYSNYYYMIRETGGRMTGAFVSDVNSDTVGENPYYDSRIGCEAYLLELGYLTNDGDLDLIVNHMDGYVMSLARSIHNYLSK